MQYRPNGQGPNDADLFSTVVGAMFTVLFLPMAWGWTAPTIARMGERSWGEGAGEPISALWGISLAVVMFASIKSSAKILFAAIALILARGVAFAV